MAELFRFESYPPVMGTEYIVPEDYMASSREGKDGCASSIWSHKGAANVLGESRMNVRALRPGAMRFTCNGGMLRPSTPPETAPLAVPESRFVRCDNDLGSSPVAAPSPPHQQPSPSLPVTGQYSFGVIKTDIHVSPFAALASQFLDNDLEDEVLGPRMGLLWPETADMNKKTEKSCVDRSEPSAMEVVLFTELPSPPARRTMEGVAAAAAPASRSDDAVAPNAATPAALNTENERDKHHEAIVRLASTVSERLRMLVVGHSSDCGRSGEEAAFSAAKPATAAASQPRTPACCMESAADHCSAASTGAPSLASSDATTSLSSRSSLDRDSGVAESKEAKDANEDTEANSAAAAACVGPAVDAGLASAAAQPQQPQRGRRRANPAPSQPAPQQRGKRRAAATVAAAVVVVAARDDDDDEDDDEDYTGSEKLVGATGRRGAKRAKKSGSATPRHLARSDVTCRSCGAKETPQWRCGPEGPRTLCNACGVRFKKGLMGPNKECKKRQMGL